MDGFLEEEGFVRTLTMGEKREVDRADELRTYANEVLSGGRLVLVMRIHWPGWKTFA